MRTLKQIASLASLIGLYATTLAQDPGEIRGKAFEPDGTPLMFGVAVAQQGERIVGDELDKSGSFVLKPLTSGMWTVRISRVGMKEVVMTGVEVGPGRITYLDDQVLASATISDTVEVVGYRRKLIERNDPGRMSLLAHEFKSSPSRKDPKRLITDNFAGVTPAPNGDGLYFRGARSENMASFIDGVRIAGAVPSIPASAISSVTVYTGGLPARYGDVTGGVVVIETKTYFEMLEERRALEEAFNE